MPAKKSSANTSAPDPHVAPPGTRCFVYLRHSPGDDQSIDSQEAAVLKEISQRGAKKSSANTSAPDPHVAPPGTRCLVYLRHSPGDDQSIDSQEAAVLKEVSQRGWKIIRIYKDEGISGKSTKKREAFERMIWQARQTPRIADILIIWDFGRFGRNMNDSMFYSAEMRLNGWRILSMNDEVPAGPMGMLFEALIHWKNEQYLIDLRQNTLRGLHYMAERGFLPGGRPPKGYIVSQEPLGTRRRDGSERLGMRCCVDAG